jgi:hypothetical protein
MAYSNLVGQTDPTRSVLSRDRVFDELMLQDGVRKNRAWFMWKAVAVLGGKAWSRMKEDDDKLVEATFATA